MAAHAQWGPNNGQFGDQFSGLEPTQPSANAPSFLELSDYSTFYDEVYFQPFSSQESSATSGYGALTDLNNTYSEALHGIISDTRENTPVEEAHLVATTSIQPVPNFLPLPLYDQTTFTISQRESSTTPRITCPECEDTTFGRKAERDRHIKEQHRCSHRDCKGRWFTAEERKDHDDEHDDKNFGFHCGSCELRGRTRRPFRRADKLKQHFVIVHGLPSRFRYSRYQCTDLSCYDNGSDGGQYFTCRLDLNKHARTVHNDVSSEFECRSTVYNAGKTRNKYLHVRRDRQPSSMLSPSPNTVNRDMIERQKKSDSKRCSSSSPSTNRMVELQLAYSSASERLSNDLISPTTGLRRLEIPSDHGGISSSDGDEEDTSAQVFDRNNAMVGILWDWDKKNPIFIPASASLTESFEQRQARRGGSVSTQPLHTRRAPRLCRKALPDPNIQICSSPGQRAKGKH